MEHQNIKTHLTIKVSCSVHIYYEKKRRFPLIFVIEEINHKLTSLASQFLNSNIHKDLPEVVFD